MRIREANIEDAAGIARVHVETWRVAYREIVAAEHLDALDVDERTQRWTGGIARPDGPIWVAEESGEIIGWACTGRTRDSDGEDDIGELYGIYVQPRFWGEDVGAGLMSKATEWLRTRFSSATLWTLAANARARRFYEKWGWSPDGAEQPLERLGGIVEVRYRVEFSSSETNRSVRSAQ